MRHKLAEILINMRDTGHRAYERYEHMLHVLHEYEDEAIASVFVEVTTLEEYMHHTVGELG